MASFLSAKTRYEFRPKAYDGEVVFQVRPLNVRDLEAFADGGDKASMYLGAIVAMEGFDEDPTLEELREMRVGDFEELVDFVDSVSNVSDEEKND